MGLGNHVLLSGGLALLPLGPQARGRLVQTSSGHFTHLLGLCSLAITKEPEACAGTHEQLA